MNGFENQKQTVKKRVAHSKHRVQDVHHDDGEGNWLVSYADLMTLLMGLFVILCAFSTPDASKMEKLKQQTAKAMGVKYTKPFEELTGELAKLLKELDLDKEVAIEETDEGISIQSKGKLFFDSGSVKLNPAAATLVEKLSIVLVQKAKDFKVVVEGHTDDVPIVSEQFPSNWELSSGRASTVVRLLESKGFPHTGLRPMGLADTEAVVPNRDAQNVGIPDNQAQNRRIIIRVQKQLPKRMRDKPTTEATH